MNLYGCFKLFVILSQISALKSEHYPEGNNAYSHGYQEEEYAPTVSKGSSLNFGSYSFPTHERSDYDRDLESIEWRIRRSLELTPLSQNINTKINNPNGMKRRINDYNRPNNGPVDLNYFSESYDQSYNDFPSANGPIGIHPALQNHNIMSQITTQNPLLGKLAKYHKINRGQSFENEDTRESLETQINIGAEEKLRNYIAKQLQLHKPTSNSYDKFHRPLHSSQESSSLENDQTLHSDRTNQASPLIHSAQYPPNNIFHQESQQTSQHVLPLRHYEPKPRLTNLQNIRPAVWEHGSNEELYNIKNKNSQVYHNNENYPLDTWQLLQYLLRHQDLMKSCKHNEIYLVCGPQCEDTCTNMHASESPCRNDCTKGCFCQPGFVRSADKSCIQLSECATSDINKSLQEILQKIYEKNVDNDFTTPDQFISNPTSNINIENSDVSHLEPILSKENYSVKSNMNNKSDEKDSENEKLADENSKQSNDDTENEKISITNNLSSFKDEKFNEKSTISAENIQNQNFTTSTFETSQKKENLTTSKSDVIGEAEKNKIKRESNEGQHCAIRDCNSEFAKRSYCRKTCNDHFYPESYCNATTDIEVEGCHCKLGYFLDTNTNICVKQEECTYCGDNEYVETCPNHLEEDDECPGHCVDSKLYSSKATNKECGSPECRCIFNYKRNSKGFCIPIQQCDPLKCTDPNEMYDPCPLENDEEYENEEVEDWTDMIKSLVPRKCTPGCVCIPNYEKDSYGNCVPIDEDSAE